MLSSVASHSASSALDQTKAAALIAPMRITSRRRIGFSMSLRLSPATSGRKWRTESRACTAPTSSLSNAQLAPDSNPPGRHHGSAHDPPTPDEARPQSDPGPNPGSSKQTSDGLPLSPPAPCGYRATRRFFELPCPDRTALPYGRREIRSERSPLPWHP